MEGTRGRAGTVIPETILKIRRHSCTNWSSPEKELRTKFPVVNSDHAIYSGNTYGPTFGGGHNLYTISNTINISNGVYALNGYVTFSDTYYQMSTVSPKVKSWDDIHNGNLNVTEIEVYKVTGRIIEITNVIIKFKWFVSVYIYSLFSN